MLCTVLYAPHFPKSLSLNPELSWLQRALLILLALPLSLSVRAKGRQRQGVSGACWMSAILAPDSTRDPDSKEQDGEWQIDQDTARLPLTFTSRLPMARLPLHMLIASHVCFTHTRRFHCFLIFIYLIYITVWFPPFILGIFIITLHFKWISSAFLWIK